MSYQLLWRKITFNDSNVYADRNISLITKNTDLISLITDLLCSVSQYHSICFLIYIFFILFSLRHTGRHSTNLFPLLDQTGYIFSVASNSVQLISDYRTMIIKYRDLYVYIYVYTNVTYSFR